MADVSILILEGNDYTIQNKYRDRTGLTPGQAYANVITKILRGLNPAFTCHVSLFSPAEEEVAAFSDDASRFDGVFITGSSLHVYEYDARIKRQIDFLHHLYQYNLPIFGSCWGLQITAASLGATIIKNPLGREIVTARNIIQTKQGKTHLLLEGRASSFDAPCVHLDMIEKPCAGMSVLAYNTMAPVQAAEICVDKTIIWGTQYHPEYALTDLAGICGRNQDNLIAENFFHDEADAGAYCSSLVALDQAQNTQAEKFKFGISREMIDFNARSVEIKNFLRFLVLPRLHA